MMDRLWHLTRLTLPVFLLLGASEALAEPPISLFDEEEGASSATGPVIESGAGGVQIERGGVQDDGGSGGGRVLTPRVLASGHNVLVEARVQGRDVYFLLDTGASYTTLTPWFAKAIGATPPKDAPQAQFTTANGRTSSPFGVLSSLELDSRSHEHVTFSLCESCGEPAGAGSKRPVVGLLGMNVLGRYRVELGEEKVTLREVSSKFNRHADIEPWLQIEVEPGPTPLRAGPSTGYRHTIAVRNRSAYKVRAATLQVICVGQNGEGRGAKVELKGLGAKKEKRETLDLPVSLEQCAQRSLRLVEADW